MEAHTIKLIGQATKKSPFIIDGLRINGVCRVYLASSFAIAKDFGETWSTQPVTTPISNLILILV